VQGTKGRGWGLYHPEKLTVVHRDTGVKHSTIPPADDADALAVEPRPEPTRSPLRSKNSGLFIPRPLVEHARSSPDAQSKPGGLAGRGASVIDHGPPPADPLAELIAHQSCVICAQKWRAAPGRQLAISQMSPKPKSARVLKPNGDWAIRSPL
jgi:hypothetical protein